MAAERLVWNASPVKEVPKTSACRVTGASGKQPNAEVNVNVRIVPARTAVEPNCCDKLELGKVIGDPVLEDPSMKWNVTVSMRKSVFSGRTAMTNVV